MSDHYIDAKQMADILNLSAETVRRKAAAGDIPALKVSNRYRFLPDEVKEALTPTDPWAMSSQSRHARRAS